MAVALASAAPPAGDNRAAPAAVRLDNLVGDLQPLRNEAGAQVFGVDISGATPAPDDPPLDQADRGSSCAGGVGAGTASVWYVLQGPGGAPLAESAWVGIDTVGSGFRNGLQVFVSTPERLERVACERENLAGGNAGVSFGVRPGQTYLLQVAVTGPTPGALTLRGRAWDIQQPRLAIETPSTAAQPGRTSRFAAVGGAATDLGAGVDPGSYRWEVGFRPAADGVERLIAFTTGDTPTAISVDWPAELGSGIGTARLTVQDLAGRSTTASLSVVVRDRTAPRVRAPAVVSLRRGRPGLRISASCSERGQVTAQLLRDGRVIRVVNRSHVRRRPTVNQAWRVRRGAYAVRYRCRDLAGNLSPFEYRLFFLR
jgi:hypothetical protein